MSLFLAAVSMTAVLVAAAMAAWTSLMTMAAVLVTAAVTLRGSRTAWFTVVVCVRGLFIERSAADRAKLLSDRLSLRFDALEGQVSRTDPSSDVDRFSSAVDAKQGVENPL